MFPSPLHYQKHTARRVSVLDEVPVVVALPVGTYTVTGAILLFTEQLMGQRDS